MLKVKKSIGMAMAVVVLGVALFAMCGTSEGRTPEATVKNIQEAIAKKDEAGIEKYIDFNSLARGVIIFTATGSDDEVAKGEFVKESVKEVLREDDGYTSNRFKEMALNGKIEKKVDSNNRFYVDPLQEIHNISGFWNWRYISMEKSKINGNKAILPIKVYDTKENIEQTVNVAMEKENGVWRVKSIANMEEIYKKYMGE